MNRVATIDKLGGSDGALSFCARCPSSACCSKIKHGGTVDAPVLLPEEASRIQELSQLSQENFSQDLHDSSFRQMRAANGCPFFRNGRCDIYEVRPVDCRLFPVDIMEREDGMLVWIVYTRICPIRFDPKRLLQHAESLLPVLQGKARAYARIAMHGMDPEPFVELGPLSQQG